MTFWENGLGTGRVLIRKGGAGNPWLILDPTGTLDAIGGGGVSAESRWGQSERKGKEYQGSRITSNPNRFTGNVSTRLYVTKFLDDLMDQNCPHDLRGDQRCSDLTDKLAYLASYWFIDNVPGDTTFSGNLLNGTDTPGDDLMVQTAVSAGLRLKTVPLSHLDISGTHQDTAINKIKSLGSARCGCDGTTETTGEEEFWACTDVDATPGYGGTSVPSIGFTQDGGDTWTWRVIDVFTSGNCTDFVIYGHLVIAVSPTNGIAFATYQDLIDGVANPWTMATGISANFPKVLWATGKHIWAAGAGGYIYRSKDGGFSFETFDAAVETTDNINSIAFATDNLGWFGADSGTLIKYSGGALSTIVVQDISAGTTMTDNINVVAVPSKRERQRQVYVGTSGGEIWRSDDVKATTPDFTNKGFPQYSTGSIVDLQFVGFRGNVLYIVQNNANSNSRVLRDLSGGYLENDVEIIGTFTSPANFGINSIAPANENFALTAGEIHVTYAFIGRVTGK